MSLSPRSAKSSLIPQRKHRKLLNGSSEEVWSERLEEIFIDGLHKYWQSPYATYSRGRSRWRNQFLVDHLQKAGITRTKKQVASHIQVLRNMWKGQPEYQLVAGGEELFSESESSSVKTEDVADRLLPFDSEESDTFSSASSPSFSPLAVKSEFPSPPQPSTLLFTPESYSPATHMAFPSTSLTYSPSSPAETDLALPPTSGNFRPPTIAAVHQAQQKQSPCTSPEYLSDAKSPTPHSPPSQYRRPSNRVTKICLLADGMHPMAFPLQGSHSTLLYIRLAMPSINDVRSPTTLHGFRGNICLAFVWSSYAKCTTRLYSGGVCTSEETVPIEVSSIDVGTVIAPLPESRLTRCRWLDSALDHMLTQEIIVDNHTLLYVIYDLKRETVFPTAQVLDCQLLTPAVLERWTSWITSTARRTEQRYQNIRPQYRTPYALAPAIRHSP